MQVQGMKQTIVELPLQPKKEFVQPLVNSASSNFPSGSKYHRKHVPKYTTPFPSPTTSQPTSPVIRNEKKSGSQSNQPSSSSSTSKQVKGQLYDLNKMAEAVTNTVNTTVDGSRWMFKRSGEGWWNCLSLPSTGHGALMGTSTTVPQVPSAPAKHVGEITLPSLSQLMSSTSTSSNSTALSPRVASPTNISPLGGPKNRMTR